jgi:hypothetical protein
MMLARCLMICWMLCLAGWAQGSLPRTPRQEWDSTATLIGAEHEMTELRGLLQKRDADRWRVLWLHQRITERVMAASLQVDATIAQIDNEIARANGCEDFWRTSATGG